MPRRCPHGVHLTVTVTGFSYFLFATALSARSASQILRRLWLCRGLCHGAVRTECIFWNSFQMRQYIPLPRRCPHGVHLQKQTNFVCIMRRELVDSFSETTRSGSCADYFPILFCCQSDLYHHDRQPRTGNRPVLLCEQHSHFLCIRPSH